ncbi:MAG: YtxH domain-containing protein [Patescibacteria group bacterium]|nr:YtxH domain-containing protein [Patescibacteria group bacterium]
MENKKASKFGLGLLIGSVIGVITALFVAPKTGKEMRELAKKWLEEELELLKKELGKIDKRKFKKAVEKVLQKVKKEVKSDVKELNKIKSQLMREWESYKKNSKIKNQKSS